MEPVSLTPVQNDLSDFIDFLYDGLEGYAYLAAKDPEGDPKNWVQEFFAIPDQRKLLETTIKAVSKTHEIYLAPALFNQKRSLREDVKISNVVWTEFDGNAPAEWDENKKPSVIIQSSLENHHHVYWKLAEPLLGPDAIEEVTKRITYAYSADSSAWDANQVLRPPGTYNHKRSSNVQVLSKIQISYEPDIFHTLPEPPTQLVVTDWKLGELPDPESLMLRWAFTEDIVLLLKQDKPSDRSNALMNLGYSLCQLGMSDVEVFTMLKLADSKWGKFKDRKDADKRLAQIITIARNKYPDLEDHETSNPTLIFDYLTFLNTVIEFDWVIEGMLMDQGNMLMAGPSGVGKTQITLEFMKHVALGKDIFHYKVGDPQRIAFWSLEMSHPELQVFMKAQDETLTDEERLLLKENLIILPVGEPWALNTKPGQEMFESVIERYRPKGVFVDSIGSAVLGNINGNDVVQPLTNFNDHIRNAYGLFTWYIHHTRKAQPGQRISTQDDVYGDQYLVNRSTSTYGILPSKSGRIRVRNWKNRLAAKENDYFLERDPKTLTFSEVKDEAMESMVSHITEQEDEPTNDKPTAGGFVL